MALVVFGSAFVQDSGRRGWTNQEIDDWFADVSSGAAFAHMFGDTDCGDLLDEIGAGFRAVHPDSIFWNSNLSGNGSTSAWRSGVVRIQINPNSDNVTRSRAHEGLHANGWGWEANYSNLPSWANPNRTHEDIRIAVGRPGGNPTQCVLDYLPH